MFPYLWWGGHSSYQAVQQPEVSHLYVTADLHQRAVSDQLIFFGELTEVSSDVPDRPLEELSVRVWTWRPYYVNSRSVQYYCSTTTVVLQ